MRPRRNVISGNTSAGVAIVDNANSNLVAGNYIGTDATGVLPLGNGGVWPSTELP